MTDIRPEFDANRLDTLMSLQDLTIYDLAQRADISPSHVSRLQHGKRRNVSAAILLRIARALDTSAEYLMGLVDDPTPFHTPPNA